MPPSRRRNLVLGAGDSSPRVCGCAADRFVPGHVRRFRTRYVRADLPFRHRLLGIFGVGIIGTPLAQSRLRQK